MSEQDVKQQANSQVRVPPTPLRCLTGMVISGGLGFAMYSLTFAIATSFAHKPIHSDNPIVVNISAAVRTLVVGVSALATGIFAVVGVGLLALAVQLSVQQLTKTNNGKSPY